MAPATAPTTTAPPTTDVVTTSPGEVELLIAATWVVAARVGSLEPSVRDILQEAGLSTKAFYRHFRSKDELLLMAFDRGRAWTVEQLRRRMADHDEPLQRIDAWITGYVRQAASPTVARRSLPWSLGVGRLAALFPEEFDRNQAAIVELLAAEIRAAVAAGEATTPDPTGDAWLVFGYTVDTVRRHLLHESTPDADTVRRLVDFAHRALGAGGQQTGAAAPR